jgi:hypothetical protein
MSSWYLRECGHRTLRSTWGDDPDEPMIGLCVECRGKLVGSRIRFIRYGDPVEYSTNHREHEVELGMSVYRLGDDGVVELRGFPWEITSRPSHRGTGEMVGWGSDGEPLIRLSSVTWE